MVQREKIRLLVTFLGKYCSVYTLGRILVKTVMLYISCLLRAWRPHTFTGHVCSAGAEVVEPPKQSGRAGAGAGLGGSQVCHSGSATYLKLGRVS